MFIQNNISSCLLKEIEDDIIKELAFNDWNYSTLSVSKILDTWSERKEKLYKTLMNHPKFNRDKLMIQFDCVTERKIDTYVIRHFYDGFVIQFDLKYRKSPRWAYTEFYDELKNITKQYLTQENADYFNSYFNVTYFRKGQKTSRAVNKIYNLLGGGKDCWFNREFAKFSDAINPKEITRHMCLSIHPMDYLLMSSGNSWSSCHDISTDSGEEPGCHCSGTISYMLDEVSMILYEVEEFDDSPYTLPKIIRQVVCFDGKHLVLNRLYPQNFDAGAESIYMQLSEVTRNLLSECFTTPIDWIKETTTDKNKDVMVYHEGTGYPDWLYISHTQFWKTSNIDWTEIKIGAAPICVECGHEHSYKDSITCCSSPPNCERWTCECCGASYTDEDDCSWSEYEEEYLCYDCRVWCDMIEDYIRESTPICEDCNGDFVPQHLVDIGEYFICEHCGELTYYRDCETTEDGYHLCSDCYDEVTTSCEYCGKIYYNEKNFKETEEMILCADCYNEYLKQLEKEQSA